MRLKVKRVICRIIGHDWTDWEDESLARSDIPPMQSRVCHRCPAYQMRVDRDAPASAIFSG